MAKAWKKSSWLLGPWRRDAAGGNHLRELADGTQRNSGGEGRDAVYVGGGRRSSRGNMAFFARGLSLRPAWKICIGSLRVASLRGDAKSSRKYEGGPLTATNTFDFCLFFSTLVGCFCAPFNMAFGAVHAAALLIPRHYTAVASGPSRSAELC